MSDYRLAVTPLGAELLDDPAADPETVIESLRNIARSNRWFGGQWRLLRHRGCRQSGPDQLNQRSGKKWLRNGRDDIAVTGSRSCHLRHVAGHHHDR
nr:hypothetical protein [Gemmatimonadales bacterium]